MIEQSAIIALIYVVVFLTLYVVISIITSLLSRANDKEEPYADKPAADVLIDNIKQEKEHGTNRRS